MKKGDKVLITWENLDGPEGIGRGMARCDVVMVRKAKDGIKPCIEVRIRDPKGLSLIHICKWPAVSSVR